MVASFAEKRFEVYDSVCPATEEAVFWYTDSDTPVTYSGAKGLSTRLQRPFADVHETCRIRRVHLPGHPKALVHVDPVKTGFTKSSA